MKFVSAGEDLIRKFEGCLLTVYLDAVGLPTVGYGHMDKTMRVGDQITPEKAEFLLQQDLVATVAGVKDLLADDLTDNQFSALVSFAFNLGIHALAGSTLLKLVNRKDYEGAAEQFLVWNHAGGKVLQGLTDRRQAEKQLFEEDV